LPCRDKKNTFAHLKNTKKNCMKKLTILAAVCIGLTFASCKGGGSTATPEAAAKAFFERIKKLDFSGAKKYATKESGAALDGMEMMMNMAKTAGKGMDGDKDMEKMKNAKFEFGAPKINGDEATISVIADGKPKDVKLKKEGGSWKVAFTKDSMTDKDGGMNKSKDTPEDMGNIGDTLNKALDQLNDPKMKEALDKLADPKNLEKLKEATEKLKDLQ
jgi:hypothetical protein